MILKMQNHLKIFPYFYFIPNWSNTGIICSFKIFFSFFLYYYPFYIFIITLTFYVIDCKLSLSNTGILVCSFPYIVTFKYNKGLIDISSLIFLFFLILITYFVKLGIFSRRLTFEFVYL